MVAIVRGHDGAGGQAVQVVLVLIVALTAGWWLDHLIDRDLAAERRTFEARALDLTARALAPGSPLTCLDAIAGEAVEEACEKALFATPEATAAAVSYVAAQLALLAAATDQARGGEAGSELIRTSLRRAVENDRFGIVAHVLALRGGCTPNRCSAFALLQDPSRVRANLMQRPFEARVRSHMAAWPAAGRPQAAANPSAPETAAVPTAAAKPPSGDLYFPSSDSIPPVNIMTAEPAARSPADATAASEAATTPRKPASGAAQPARPPPASSNAPARSAPLPLAPGAQ